MGLAGRGRILVEKRNALISSAMRTAQKPSLLPITCCRVNKTDKTHEQ